MTAALERFEAMLDGRAYLMGDAFSAADCAAYPFLKYAAWRDPADDELFHRVLDGYQQLGDGHQGLAAWIARVDERPPIDRSGGRGFRVVAARVAAAACDEPRAMRDERAGGPWAVGVVASRPCACVCSVSRSFSACSFRHAPAPRRLARRSTGGCCAVLRRPGSLCRRPASRRRPRARRRVRACVPPAAGASRFAGRVPRGGRTVSVRCGPLVATYQHLGAVAVRRGQVVVPGGRIGTVGRARPRTARAPRRARRRHGRVRRPARAVARRAARGRRRRCPRARRAAAARPGAGARGAGAARAILRPAPRPRRVPPRRARAAPRRRDRLPWPVWLGLALVALGLPLGGFVTARGAGGASPAPVPQTAA